MINPGVVSEARDVAQGRTPEEVKALSEGRQETEVEKVAHFFALEDEIKESMRAEKARKIDRDQLLERDKTKAETLYIIAKEDLRLEKERHRVAMEEFSGEIRRHKAEADRHQVALAEFAVEKANHTAERKRHAMAVAQFQQDAEPWRRIVRAEKEVERQARKAQEDEVDRWVAEQQDKKEAATVSDAKSEGYKDTLSSI